MDSYYRKSKQTGHLSLMKLWGGFLPTWTINQATQHHNEGSWRTRYADAMHFPEVMTWLSDVCNEVLRRCCFRHSYNKRLIETVLIRTKNTHFVRTKAKGKVRVSLCTSWRHMVSTGIVPFIFNLGMCDFIPQPPDPAKEHLAPFESEGRCVPDPVWTLPVSARSATMILLLYIP